MIVLHHLNQSRSLRILWLLEEIGVPYELKRYQRDANTGLAPDSLKAIHPLGKSPVIEWEGKVITESGAIVEILIEHFAPHLAPIKGTSAYYDYLQWMHFAESSAMVPLLLGLFASKEPATLQFLPQYAASEQHKILQYINEYLADKTYLVANKLTGADFMLSFVVEALTARDKLQSYPHIQRYAQQLASHESWQRAQQIEANG